MFISPYLRCICLQGVDALLPPKSKISLNCLSFGKCKQWPHSLEYLTASNSCIIISPHPRYHLFTCWCWTHARVRKEVIKNLLLSNTATEVTRAWEAAKALGVLKAQLSSQCFAPWGQGLSNCWCCQGWLRLFFSLLAGKTRWNEHACC